MLCQCQMIWKTVGSEQLTSSALVQQELGQDGDKEVICNSSRSQWKLEMGEPQNPYLSRGTFFPHSLFIHLYVNLYK